MTWPEVRLHPALASVVRGVTFSQADASDVAFEGGVPVLRAGNIQRRLIIDDDLVWVDRSFVGEDQYLKRNDIVVCTSSGSASLVGKSAILAENFHGTWGAFNAVVRCKAEILMPEYFAYWLSSQAFRVWKDRHVQGANIQNIRQSALESIRVPLPALIEQKRIVDVLQRAEASSQANTRGGDLDQLIKSALDDLVIGRDESEWMQLGSLVDTRYGTSVSAGATRDTGAPVLRIPNVIGGEVDTADMKYVQLNPVELSRLQLTAADVLIVRSNGNPEYVGRSAPITEDVCQSVIVYASYLIRLRTDAVRLLPEYLSAFLNSSYGRAALRNAIRTTAGQSNLSGENLAKVRLPVPDIEAQKRFRRLWLQVREIRRVVRQSEEAATALRSALSVDALSGDLTAQWREHHAVELALAALTRDELLRERGSKTSFSATIAAPPVVQADLTVRPARHWLLGELSDFQRNVLAAFTTYCEGSGQPLLAEDPDVFARFCDDTSVTERLQSYGSSQGNRIRRTLSQLAALGLIAKVTLPKVDAESGERDYLKAFRPVRDGEFTRMADLQTLRKALSAGVDDEHYHLQAQLDYETSEHAGAGGMFQVISIEDDEGKDYTHLVDQGRHYASLEDLKLDLASALQVAVKQVDLEAV